MHVRMRSIVHPQAGVSEPVYLGEAVRNLSNRDSQELEIVVDRKNLSKLQG
jgi:hypothetical protein